MQKALKHCFNLTFSPLLEALNIICDLIKLKLS